MGLKNRSLCTCIPLFLVFALYLAELLAYEYVFVYDLLYISLNRVALAIFCSVTFLVLWILSLWSYGASAFRDPGLVSDWFEGKAAELGLPVAGSSEERLGYSPGYMQFCTRCRRNRPQRAHHCDSCDSCVLRMDHHCQFINNCVGYGNMKAFILWIFWTVVLSGFVLASSTTFVVNTMVTSMALNRTSWSPLFLYAWATYIALFISLIMLLVLHASNIVRNVTEIELLYLSKRNPYDLGKLENFEQIFGKGYVSWLLPIEPWKPTCDGVQFPVAEQQESLLQGV
eukprot:Lankesteria_metandrocarpae@DN5056_c0_g2_i2.p1